MVKFTDIPWVHNWLYPTLMALASALVTAFTSNAIPILADGIQPGDMGRIGGVLLAAAVGFFATLMTRYAGGTEKWTLPSKQPDQTVTTTAGDAPK